MRRSKVLFVAQAVEEGLLVLVSSFMLQRPVNCKYGEKDDSEVTTIHFELYIIHMKPEALDRGRSTSRLHSCRIYRGEALELLHHCSRAECGRAVRGEGATGDREQSSVHSHFLLTDGMAAQLAFQGIQLLQIMSFDIRDTNTEGLRTLRGSEETCVRSMLHCHAEGPQTG